MYSLNPDDFRYTWANAYALTLVQLSEMHDRADKQLNASLQVYNSCKNLYTHHCNALYEASNAAEKRIESAASRSESRIDAATEILLKHINWIRGRETNLAQRQINFEKDVSIQFQKMNLAKRNFSSKSLLKRLWVALRNNLESS